MVTLITGGAGFIGHHLVDHLLRSTEDELVLIDRLDSSGNLHRLQEVMHAAGCDRYDITRVRFVYHDLRSAINDHTAARIGRVDRILHLGALTHVDRSIEDPMAAVQDNVVATCHLLNFARAVRPDLFLYFSTDEVFGPAPEGVAYKEWDRYKSGNPYAATKAGGEELALAFHNTYGVPVMITHTMNVIGERQSPEKFVPMTIKKVRDGEKVLIHSDWTRTIPGSRYYIHASRVAEAVSFIMDHGEPGQKYNIVGEREIDNLALAQMIADVMEVPLEYEMVDFHSSRPGHDLRYALDGSLLRDMGLVYTSSIERDIEHVVRWTLSNPHWLF